MSVRVVSRNGRRQMADPEKGSRTNRGTVTARLGATRWLLVTGACLTER